MKKHIPNIITGLNLFSGSIGVWLAFEGDYFGVALAILASAVFDFLDGFMARVLNVYSDIGKELDSLADMVSFGLLPGALVFSMWSQSTVEYYRFIAFLIPVFSAFRLAKFNLDERQTTSFIGLPTPANAIFWVGITLSWHLFLEQNPILLGVIVMVSSLLLVVELPMFSLKFKNFGWKDNQLKYLFLFGCIILIVVWRIDTIALLIVWYVFLSVVSSFVEKRKK